jgi:hypothetical protein
MKIGISSSELAGSIAQRRVRERDGDRSRAVLFAPGNRGDLAMIVPPLRAGRPIRASCGAMAVRSLSGMMMSRRPGDTTNATATFAAPLRGRRKDRSIKGR